MSYTAEQRHIINLIKGIGHHRGESTRRILAALTIGRVESNFRNLHGGDADSAGWRQERRSLYRNPTNLRMSINRVFDEMAQHDRGQSIGELAADVQRPAAQYRGRYAEHLDEARKLLGGGGDAALRLRSATTPGRTPRLIPGSTTTDNSAAMVAALLDHRKKMSLLDRFQSAVQSGVYTTTTPTRIVPGQPGSSQLSAVPGDSNSGRKSRLAKGTATFEGKTVAAWIKPILVYARKHGWTGTVTSGFRSFAEQQRIYNSGVRPAAVPGTSNHEGSDFPRGAVDVSGAAQLAAILHRSPFRHRLVWAGSKDPVHFSHPHDGHY